MNLRSLIFSVMACSVFQAHAGIKLTCPDLSKNESASGWTINGSLQQASFNKVLISMNRVMGSNTVTCQYDAPVTLTKIGNFQPAAEGALWQSVNLGGLVFKQCIATVEVCDFYSAN